MEELFKTFRHIARDLFIYILAGGVLLADMAYMDYLLNDNATYLYLKGIENYPVMLIFAAYVIGQLIFAAMYVVFEVTGLEDFFKKAFFSRDENGKRLRKEDRKSFAIDARKEIYIFTNALAIHEQFVERHTQLYIMRWNLAGSLFASSCINLILGWVFGFTASMIWVTLAFLACGATTYILSLRTEKDCVVRVNEAHNLSSVAMPIKKQKKRQDEQD